jgi:S-adenosylmethionine hydrolase
MPTSKDCRRLSEPPRRIALLTDFGAGPYIGQMQLLLSAIAAGVPALSLIADLAPFRPDLAGYLLPGLSAGMPTATLYVCVVDPGVGGERGVLAASVGGNWLIGPDNGLLVPSIRRDAGAHVYRVAWRPTGLSDSFHGRDLFAPLAARLVQGELPEATPVSPDDIVGADWPAQLAKVCYVDHFGNLISGLPASGLDPAINLSVGGFEVGHARTFCEVPVGQPFWYRNAFGLLEIAVNQGRADRVLGLSPGDELPFPQWP